MNPNWIAAPCPELSQDHRKAALTRQSQLTKPTGSLGRLENLAVDLAAIQHTASPRADRAPIIVFAGDHGIAAQRVSAYPQDVTIAMLANFASGGAAISVLARQLGSTLEVVDAGTLAQAPIAGVITDKPRHGSSDFSVEPALTARDLDFALSCGRRAVERALVSTPDILLLGEMGIANTSASAAIAASLLGLPAREITGAGTGLDASGQNQKALVIEAALERHGLRFGASPVRTVLQSVGGLEIAALAGAILAAAQAGKPILADGFIVSVAALAAARLNPSCRPYLIFSHRSAERGHRIVLDALEAKPLLDLDLRLGEGSGAALALPLVRLACALHNGMATFAEAAVPDRER